MSSPPSKADLQAMANGLESGINQLQNQLSELQPAVQQELTGKAAVACAPLAGMVAAMDQSLQAQAQQLAGQTQALVAALGMLTDQAAAVMATDMTGAGLDSPIAAVTSDLIQDYGSCDTTSAADTTSTTTTCPPVEVHVTCEPCATPTDTTTHTTDTTSPTNTTSAPPPDQIPPPSEPPPPVDQGKCTTYQQCRPDDLSWLGYQADPYLSLLAPDPSGIAAAVSAYVPALDDVIGTAASLDDVFNAVLAQAPPEGEYASYDAELISKVVGNGG